MVGPLHQNLALHCDRDDARYELAAALELHDDAYHVRVQEIVGSIAALDGTGLLRDVARASFGEALGYVLHGVEDGPTRIGLVEGYYAYLGLGMVWLDTLESGLIDAPSALVASTWARTRPNASRLACAVTEGFLEAAVRTITGWCAEVRELRDAELGARCRYAVTLHGPAAPTERAAGSGAHLRLLPTPARVQLQSGVDGLIEIDGRWFAHVPAGLYAKALAEWLALAASSGAPLLALALAQLDYVSAPAAAPLRLAPQT
ncbi:MAG: hypothetical protein IAG13_36075 [Deltaproteobacteria bacterium]|nr:hypothetical protein [Nannocystaceae bacterium]